MQKNCSAILFSLHNPLNVQEKKRQEKKAKNDIEKEERRQERLQKNKLERERKKAEALKLEEEERLKASTDGEDTGANGIAIGVNEEGSTSMDTSSDTTPTAVDHTNGENTSADTKIASPVNEDEAEPPVKEEKAESSVKGETEDVKKEEKGVEEKTSKKRKWQHVLFVTRLYIYQPHTQTKFSYVQV